MFQELLKLYKNNSNKIPLEDFNTECFSGILRLFPDILNEFITTFLQLPDDKYKIETQSRERIEGDQNCIIDFVVRGKKHICFIENKIESKEGANQLNKYARVLEQNYSDYEKYLFYCTKYSEPKNQKGDYHFKQFKWYEIAKFLKRFDKNELINDYIQFLKYHRMEQDNTFRINNLLALENLNKSLDIVQFHINNAREEFNKRFYHATYRKNFNWNQIEVHKRIAHYGKDILKSEGYSEVLYSIQLETLELNVHLYVHSDHKKLKEFNEVNLTNTNFQMVKWDCGTSIYKLKQLGEFLNDENSDLSIKKWFTESFDELLELIKSNPQLEWNIKQ